MDTYIRPNTNSECEFGYCEDQNLCLFQNCKTLSEYQKEVIDAFTIKSPTFLGITLTLVKKNFGTLLLLKMNINSL